MIGGSLNDRDLRVAMRGLTTEARRLHARHGRELAEASFVTRDVPAILRLQQTVQARAVVRGWLVLASIDPLLHDQGAWHFSASLHPRGRSSMNADWEVLGKIVGLSDAPDDVLEQVRMQVSAGTHPNRPHHWLWPLTGTEAEHELVRASLLALRQLVAPTGTPTDTRTDEAS